MYYIIFYSLISTLFFSKAIYKLIEYSNQKEYNYEITIPDKKINDVFSLLSNTHNIKDKSILVIGNSNSSTITILSNMLNYTSNITLLLIEDKLHYNTSDLVKYCKSNNITCIYRSVSYEILKNKLKVQMIENFASEHNIEHIILNTNFEDYCNSVLLYITTKTNNIQCSYYKKNNINYYTPLINTSENVLDNFCKNNKFYYDNRIDCTNINNIFHIIIPILDYYHSNWKQNLVSTYKDIKYLNRVSSDQVEYFYDNITTKYEHGIMYNFELYDPTLNTFSKNIKMYVDNINDNDIATMWKHLKQSYLFEVTERLNDDYFYYCKNNILIIFNHTEIQNLIKNSNSNMSEEDISITDNNLENFLNGNFYYYNFMEDSEFCRWEELLILQINVPIKILSLFDFSNSNYHTYNKVCKSKIE